MRRLFVPPDALGGATTTLTGEPHHYLAHVLRLGVGDPVLLFDGAGNEVEAEVARVGRDETELRLGGRRPHAVATGRVLLLQALPRGDRMEWILQKTTELGVATIAPVMTARSVVRLAGERAASRQARWEKIAREAARQCGRSDVPQILEPKPLAGALAVAAEAPTRLALWEGAQAGLPLRAALAQATGTVALLVGPEGGLSADEVAEAHAAGFAAVTLGPRILRVETAAVVAVALAQAAAGALD